MSIWENYSIEARVRDILDVPPRESDHHFGRPFLTAYQIAISFAKRFPDDHDLIGKPIRELSDRIRNGHVTGIEGADLNGGHINTLEYHSPEGDVESSVEPNLSMFRLRNG